MVLAVPGRVPLGGAHDLGARAPVEIGGLEAVGLEDDLPAAAPGRLALRGGEERAAVPAPPEVLTDPEVAHVAAAAPRPRVETGDDLVAGSPDEAGKFAPIVDAGRGEVEGVDALLEEADVGRGRVGVDGDGRYDAARGHVDGSPSRAGSSHDSPPVHSASRTKRLLTVQVRPNVQK